MKIEQIQTEKLIPYARNSKLHSEAQVGQIAASIREFGFNNPVLIDKDNGIIAGHGRVLGAQKLGIESVPCLRLSHLTDIQKRAYIIADNRLSETGGGWDTEMLALEIEDLRLEDFDIDLTGFDADALEAMFEGGDTEDDGTAGLTDPDEVPEPPADPTSKLGDVWVLGKHRIMCGDSTDAGSVSKLMAGEKAALLHADPPYGMGKESDGVMNDNLYRDKLDAFQMSWWSAFRSSLDDNASAYIWGNAPDIWRLWYLGDLADSERLTFRNEIVWDKGGGGFGVGTEAQRCYFPEERCLFFMLGEQGFNNNADNYWEGWEPIRAYLEGEMKKCGWTVKDLNRITNTQMGGHWVTKSQWVLITEEHYTKIQNAARDHDAFKRDHDELKRDFYATRAYFDNTHDNMTDVWEFPRVTGEDRHGHATPKPVAMIARAMKSSLPKDGLCIEPFSGSGTTIMACEKTERRCYAMELSPQYVDVAVKRWQDFTGQTAILESTGEPFPS